MSSIEIPQSQRAPLKTLLRLDSLKREALLDSLEEAGSSLVASRAALADATGLSAADADDTLYMLLGLYHAHRRRVLDPASLTKALRADDDLGAEASGDEEDLESFFERLFTLESSLGILSKAYRLTREHAHTYCAADIVSDLRPVFDDVEGRPVAATLVHTLRLAYHKGPSLKLEELFIGLSKADLEHLSSVISRALKKDKSLEDFAKEARLPLLSTEDE